MAAYWAELNPQHSWCMWPWHRSHSIPFETTGEWHWLQEGGARPGVEYAGVPAAAGVAVDLGVI